MFKFYIKNVIYVVHVLVKRSKIFQNNTLYSSLCEVPQCVVSFEPRTLRTTSDGVNE